MTPNPPSPPPPAIVRAAGRVVFGEALATAVVIADGEQRVYRLTSTALPYAGQVNVAETPSHATVRTGDALFDGLYALAVSEACANSVPRISDAAYANGEALDIEAFQTGELWPYVWTRDLAYALHLGLAGFDPKRAIRSLLFKASSLKPSVLAGRTAGQQIVQDTGSGGSYPVSTDRVVWVLGAHAVLEHLAGQPRQDFLAEVYPILCATIEQDRRLVFDCADDLYRGEQSFLDWREQTYPRWTKDNVLPIAMSKALSVNVADFYLLRRAAEYAGRLGETETQARYAGWAEELRTAINRGFWDEAAGLYSTYLLSEDGVSDAVRVRRYDLLGESLAILCGVADERQSAAIVQNYPVGPAGAPVAWPQERTVPIYHNQGMWPFVTAYWLKAARQAGNAAAVDAGVRSLEGLAALNLSNLENYDFVTGSAEVRSGTRTGPVVDSRRQLWSVAGYLSMVQDGVFGLETLWEGVRFRPCITARMRRETFGGTDVIAWHRFEFRNTRHTVRVHLPPAAADVEGICMVTRVELNGASVGENFVAATDLSPDNAWNIYLDPPKLGSSIIRSVDTRDEDGYCGPVQPSWQEVGQGGITLDDNRLTLHFEGTAPGRATLNIYRDGQLCADGVRGTVWTDPQSGDYHEHVHAYRVEAADTQHGNVSHLTPARSYRLPNQMRVIPAADLHGRGGELVDNHVVDWGLPADELSTVPLTVPRRGTYLVRVEFSNGAGPVQTGVACAVKKLSVLRADSGAPVVAGYVVMPQSGNWQRFDLSSAVAAELAPGESYVLRLSEDDACLNMSYLQSNERYTAAAGGGSAAYNRVHVAAIHLLYLKARP